MVLQEFTFMPNKAKFRESEKNWRAGTVGIFKRI